MGNRIQSKILKEVIAERKKVEYSDLTDEKRTKLIRGGVF